MNQLPFLELEQGAEAAAMTSRRTSETGADSLSQVVDKRRVRRLSTIADKLQRSADTLDRAKLAGEARDIADALVEESILEANRSGLTWREIGTRLGIPFQTLHRRYGGR